VNPQLLRFGNSEGKTCGRDGTKIVACALARSRPAAERLALTWRRDQPKAKSVTAQSSDFLALALCSAAVQEISRVNVLALRAMSDVFNSGFVSAV
jgi:hypothetical protein